jgi:hypothetical protein
MGYNVRVKFFLKAEKNSRKAERRSKMGENSHFFSKNLRLTSSIKRIYYPNVFQNYPTFKGIEIFGHGSSAKLLFQNRPTFGGD